MTDRCSVRGISDKIHPYPYDKTNSRFVVLTAFCPAGALNLQDLENDGVTDHISRCWKMEEQFCVQTCIPAALRSGRGPHFSAFTAFLGPAFLVSRLSLPPPYGMHPCYCNRRSGHSFVEWGVVKRIKPPGNRGGGCLYPRKPTPHFWF